MGWKFENWEIKEKKINRGRWMLNLRYNGSRLYYPQAQYNWLKGNPAFADIPSDYLIHHLDGDPLNDDISNLVIMYKFHHIAYHWKNKTKIVEVKVGYNDELGTPYKKPRLCPHKRKNGIGYFINYFVRDMDGKIKRKRLYSWKDSTVTAENGERLIEYLWPDKPWEIKI